MNSSLSAFTITLLLLAAGVGAAPGITANTTTTKWQAVEIVAEGHEQVVQRPEECDSLRFSFIVGSTNQSLLRIIRSDGSQVRVPLFNQDDKRSYFGKQPKVDPEAAPAPALDDAALLFRPWLAAHVRPLLRRYTEKQQEELQARWQTLPPASQQTFTLELRQQEGFFERYLNGHYIGYDKGSFDSVWLKLPDGGRVFDAVAGNAWRDDRFLPLEMAWLARPGAFSNAVLSLDSGLQQIDGVPLQVAHGSASADVGVVRQMKGSWMLEVDEHLSRTPFDGMPESIITTVPAAYYSRAWVLCGFNPAKGVDPIVTAKMTRHARSGRGGAISSTTVELPRQRGDKLPANVREVGEIRLEGTNLPLYLVEFDLKPGEILDLLAMEEDKTARMMSQPYLDIDFMGKPGRVGAQWDGSKKPDNKSQSGVHLFGITLEKMPLKMKLIQSEPGNIFHNSEEPVVGVELQATAPDANGNLRWTICDDGGRELQQQSIKVSFGRVGDQQSLKLPLLVSRPGWYGLRLELIAPDGRVWLRHEAAFAQLGTDTRQAGYESPFGSSWFAGTHHSGGEMEIAGKLFLKAGLRQGQLLRAKFDEADFAPWKVTQNAIPWRIRPKSFADREAAKDELEPQVRELLQRFPHCNSATIFHESYSSKLPAELFGASSVEDEAQLAKIQKMVELGNFMGEFYRERFPQVRLVVGNTTHSSTIISALLRHGLKPEYIDAIGIEVVGQSFLPERLTGGGIQGAWLARETARRLGHEIPLTACPEFIYRLDRTLGQRRQAEFYARDVLISLAYGFDRVTPSLLMDVGNSYYNTLWGGSGLCQRYPLIYPKQSYVALATLTRVLDRAALVEQVPTGSHTVYALRFKRADGNQVLALWTPVGAATLELEFEQRTAIETIGLLGAGNQSREARRQQVVATTAPCYVVSSQPATAVNLLERRYDPPPATFKPLESLSSTNTWQLSVGDPKVESKSYNLPYRKPGSFKLSEVKDAERGACLEVELLRSEAAEALVSEYTFVELKEPLAVPDQPSDIGLWLKGDSGWGKVIFEIEDAKGKRWRTEGPYHDWPGELYIGFDGWRFMRYPIDGYSSEINPSPTGRWGGAYDAKPAMPLKLRGLYLALNRQALGLTEMRPAAAVIRIQDIGFVY